jgi:hypothetical protein
MPDNLTVDQVKQKAKDLKAIIEGALKAFKDQTGYVPEVKVETKEHRTNDKTFVKQTVTVTIQM